MKIGFPVLKADATAELQMSKHMHQCEYLGIYNPDTEDIDIKSVNEFQALGAETNLMQCFISEGISCILSPEFHPMAAKYFVDHGIRLYKTQSNHALTSIKEFLSADLQEFNRENTIQKKSCSSECGSRSSTCSEEEPVQELVSI